MPMYQIGNSTSLSNREKRGALVIVSPRLPRHLNPPIYEPPVIEAVIEAVIETVIETVIEIIYLSPPVPPTYTIEP